MKINYFCYLMLLLIFIGCQFIPHPLWGWLLLVNVLTLLLYGGDKLAASKGWQRLPEFTLLLFGILGGWIGGFLGQQLFRHKTQKQPFKTYFILSVAVNLLAMLAVGYWLYGRMVV